MAFKNGRTLATAFFLGLLGFGTLKCSTSTFSNSGSKKAANAPAPAANNNNNTNATDGSSAGNGPAADQSNAGGGAPQTSADAAGAGAPPLQADSAVASAPNGGSDLAGKAGLQAQTFTAKNPGDIDMTVTRQMDVCTFDGKAHNSCDTAAPPASASLELDGWGGTGGAIAASGAVQACPWFKAALAGGPDELMVCVNETVGSAQAQRCKPWWGADKTDINTCQSVATVCGGTCGFIDPARASQDSGGGGLFGFGWLADQPQ